MFHERFSEAMKQSGITGKEMADILRVKPATVSQYKSGRVRPSFERLVLICDTLDVSADYLLGRKAI